MKICHQACLFFTCLFIANSAFSQRKKEPRPIVGTQFNMGFRSNSNLVLSGGGYVGARWANYAAFMAYEFEQPASGPVFHMLGPMADYYLAEHPRKDWVVMMRLRCMAGIVDHNKGMAINNQYEQATSSNLIGNHRSMILKLGLNIGTVFHWGHWYVRAGLGPTFNWMKYVQTDNRIQLKLVPAGEMMLAVQYEF